MNDSEQKLIREMRTTAASHRLKGETRTCELLERAALKLEKALARDPSSPGGASGCGHVPAGYSCVTPGCSNGPSPEPSEIQRLRLFRDWVIGGMHEGEYVGQSPVELWELTATDPAARSAPEPPEKLRIAAAELVEYLDGNHGYNTVGAGSILHRKLKDALSLTKDDAHAG